MKGDAEWESVTAKVSGKESNYKQMRVSCFVAVMDDDPSNPVCVQVGPNFEGIATCFFSVDCLDDCHAGRI